MEQILPGKTWWKSSSRFPKAGNGRRPYPLETMLRIHCMQHWYNLAMARWKMLCTKCPVCFGYPWIALADRTTIMNFRHQLEQHQLAANCSRPSIAGWQAFDVSRHLWSMPPSLRHPARPRTKSSNAIRRCIRPPVALWHEGPHWCRCQEWHDPQPSHHRPTASISWVIWYGEEQFVPADGLLGATARGRGGCGLMPSALRTQNSIHARTKRPSTSNT